jgi:hypothetical protein
MKKLIKWIKKYHISIGIDPNDGKLHYNELKMIIVFSLVIVVFVVGIILLVFGYKT